MNTASVSLMFLTDLIDGLYYTLSIVYSEYTVISTYIIYSYTYGGGRLRARLRENEGFSTLERNYRWNFSAGKNPSLKRKQSADLYVRLPVRVHAASSHAFAQPISDQTFPKKRKRQIYLQFFILHSGFLVLLCQPQEMDAKIKSANA